METKIAYIGNQVTYVSRPQMQIKCDWNIIIFLGTREMIVEYDRDEHKPIYYLS